MPEIWRKLEDILKIPHTEPVLSQSVNRYIFNQLLLLHFTHQEGPNTTKEWAVMSGEEEAAIRFAGGFVALKLKKHS